MCAGWAVIGLTWFYCIVWWQFIDLAKVIVQKVPLSIMPAPARLQPSVQSVAQLLHAVDCIVVRNVALTSNSC